MGSPQLVRLEVRDPDSGRRVDRVITLVGDSKTDQARLVAIVAVELVAASRSELKEPAAAVVAAPAAPEPRALAVAVTPAPAPAPPRPRWRALALGSLRHFAGLPRLLPGGGLAVERSWARGFGLSADVLAEGAAQPVALGDVDAFIASFGVVGSWRVERGRFAWDSGVGARGGVARLAGRSPPPVQTSVLSEPWTGPLVAARAQAAVSRRVVLSLGGELGYVTSAVVGHVDRAHRRRRERRLVERRARSRLCAVSLAGDAKASSVAFALASLLVSVLATGCHTRGGLVLSLAPGAAGPAKGGGGARRRGRGRGGRRRRERPRGRRTATAGAAGGVDAGMVVNGTTFYIAPDGSDGNPGTSQSAPWRTFAHALPVLGPGSTLVLLDGMYTSATSGLLQVFCGTNAVNGTTAQPITVRALNERQAFISGDGDGPPVELSACANWVIEGLHAEETDVPNEMGDEPGSVVVLTRCTNVLVRRVLAAHPNRYLTASAFVIAHGASNIVIEECEALDFHYYGFHAYDSQHATFRRDYAHSRDTPDVAGGQATAAPTRGDGGFLLTKSSAGIIENCIAEDVADGFTIRASRTVQGGRVQPQRDQLLGDVANGVSHAGFLLDSQCAGTKPCNQGDQIVSDAALADVVSRGGAFGISIQGGVSNNVASASLFDATDTGISLSLDTDNAGLQSSAYARTTFVTSPGAPFGFHSTGQFNWGFIQCNSFGPTMAFAPRDSHVMNGTTVDPQLGGCLVYVPETSPLKTQGAAGSGGTGANIIYQYVGGELTTTKLWDQTTGQFPCGAVVAGLNDPALADVSCMGVGARLHVGAMGCLIP